MTKLSGININSKFGSFLYIIYAEFEGMYTLSMRIYIYIYAYEDLGVSTEIIITYEDMNIYSEGL